MDPTTKTLMVMTLAALCAMSPAGAADAGEETGTTNVLCPPVWVDSQGEVHVDPTCIGPVLDNRR
jgi:hypothetical protein